MARLADATVLVDAGERSGTRHQVREAIGVGRLVLVHVGLVGRIAWVTELVQRKLVTPWATTAEAFDCLAGQVTRSSRAYLDDCATTSNHAAATAPDADGKGHVLAQLAVDVR